ncbi:MAG: glycosyltransferase [Planctomycetes bacterium]|nr:glycosyltransferase [Planctomycetota bacterium]
MNEPQLCTHENPRHRRFSAVNSPQSIASISFSVIIPLYNKAAFVTRSIHSVLGQSHRHFECIIIDDGSTDDSLAVARSFADPRIKIISKANAGVSSARNAGLAIAQFPFVAFLDADDWWDLDYLKQMTGLITRFPCNNLYFSSHFAVYPDGRSELRQALRWAGPGESASFNIFEYFRLFGAYNWPLHTSCSVARTEAALRAGGFDERISLFEDYDFFSRLAAASDFAYLNLPLTYYNCDLPANLRLSGSLPPIRKNWVCYMLNGELARSPNREASCFIHNFAVILLLQYRKVGMDTKLVHEISSRLKFSLLSPASIARHICPVALIPLIQQVRSLVMHTRTR